MLGMGICEPESAGLIGWTPGTCTFCIFYGTFYGSYKKRSQSLGFRHTQQARQKTFRWALHHYADYATIHTTATSTTKQENRTQSGGYRPTTSLPVTATTTLCLSIEQVQESPKKLRLLASALQVYASFHAISPNHGSPIIAHAVPPQNAD